MILAKMSGNVKTFKNKRGDRTRLEIFKNIELDASSVYDDEQG